MQTMTVSRPRIHASRTYIHHGAPRDNSSKEAPFKEIAGKDLFDLLKAAPLDDRRKFVEFCKEYVHPSRFDCFQAAVTWLGTRHIISDFHHYTTAPHEEETKSRGHYI